MTAPTRGDPAPWFTAAAPNDPKFDFATVAGRHIVLSFFGSAAAPVGARFLAQVHAQRAVFDDTQIAFFGVSNDPGDTGRVQPQPVGVRFFWDFDRAVARLYGVVTDAEPAPLTSFLLDINLRVLWVIKEPDPDKHAAALFGVLARLPKIPPPAPAARQAPLLVVPYIFEPDFCKLLIELYQTHGGEESGFARDQDGKTINIVDHDIKRRKDYFIGDDKIRAAIRARISRRLLPEIKKAFQFEVTRMERYIVACYSAEEGGFFRAHRDNTTKGTAHRRFAVTLNLNADEYEGGNLRFPEYGSQLYRAPTGGAVVFSCSLLHEATPVTKGTRYVFLPFLYDETAAAIREASNPYLGEDVGQYRPGRIADEAASQA